MGEYKRNRKPSATLDCERAMRFYRLGMIDREIAQRCGVSSQAVANWRCRSCLPSNAARPTGTAIITPLDWDAAQARKHGVTYGEWRGPAFESERERLLEDKKNELH